MVHCLGGPPPLPLWCPCTQVLGVMGSGLGEGGDVRRGTGGGGGVPGSVVCM